MIDAKIQNLEEVIDYMKEKKKLKRVLIQTTSSIVNKLIVPSGENSPIDILILSVYQGKVIFLNIISFCFNKNVAW